MHERKIFMKNKEPIRIAQIIGKWVGGGVEAVVMNYYRNIDHKKIQFDFICDNDSTNIPYEEIESLGGQVILVPPYQKVFSYQKKLKKVLKENNYKIVHSHINALSVFPLRAAQKVGVNVRIAHSHSTTNKKEWKKNLIKIVLRPFSKIYATDYFACTEHAGRWMFGNKAFNEEKVFVMNNAIDLDKFKYDENIRILKRKELGIDDNTLVIGHIGRFVQQKNHDFLIDIFNEIHKENKNSILLLAGQGPLVNKIKEKVKLLSLTDSIIFLGQREDVSELYQAFDVFLLPSLYEGLGVVLIEAQCAGCYCIASNEVPKIAKVTNNLEFLPLNNNENEWCNLVEKNNLKSKRRNHMDDIKDLGYDIIEQSKKLKDIYLRYDENVNREKR